MNNLVKVYVEFTEHDEFNPCGYLCTPEAALSLKVFLEDKAFNVKMYNLDGEPWKKEWGIHGFNLPGYIK